MARVPALRDIGEVPFRGFLAVHQRAFAAFLALLLAGSAFAADKDADKDASDTQADKPDPMLVEPQSSESAAAWSSRAGGSTTGRWPGPWCCTTRATRRTSRPSACSTPPTSGRDVESLEAPDHLHLQWRPELGHGLAAHGRLRASARGDQRRQPATPAAPYAVVNNDFSLLDASDLVVHRRAGRESSRLIAADEDKDKRKDQMKDRRK